MIFNNWYQKYPDLNVSPDKMLLCVWHTRTCSLPGLAYNSHEFRLILRVKSMYWSFGGLWASYSHGRSRVPFEVQNWLFFVVLRIPFYIYLLPPNLTEVLDGKPFFSVCSFSSTEPLTSAESFAGELRYFVGDQDFSKYIVRSYPDDTEVFDLRRISSQSSSNKCNWTEISY